MYITFLLEKHPSLEENDFFSETDDHTVPQKNL